ncbi:DNA mismatch repair protein msh6 [Polyrhizophydium stewartii]|uniref:DNA mismatch repair protein n=1 Tax=Polyrhizophydium stewartii TaxID=2732419 RepID=A0ABR4NA25_9FUNG
MSGAGSGKENTMNPGARQSKSPFGGKPQQRQTTLLGFLSPSPKSGAGGGGSSAGLGGGSTGPSARTSEASPQAASGPRALEPAVTPSKGGSSWPPRAQDMLTSPPPSMGHYPLQLSTASADSDLQGLAAPDIAGLKRPRDAGFPASSSAVSPAGGVAPPPSATPRAALPAAGAGLSVHQDEDEDEMPASQKRRRRKRSVVDDDDDDEDGDYKPPADDEMDIDAAADAIADDEGGRGNEWRPSTPRGRAGPSSARSTTPNRSQSPEAILTPRAQIRTASTGESRLSAFSPSSGLAARKGQVFAVTSSEKKKVARMEQFKDKNEQRYSWLLDIKDADGRAPDDPDYDPRTLYIPKSAWNSFSPFEKQFWEIKATHWDTVVFFKKGKFYELYEKDADIGHQHFDLKLTDRVNMRMAGVPESSFDHWAAQFIAKGYKVAKVEQMENAVAKSMRDRESSKKEDKIIRRELTSVLTAGTLVDAGLLTKDMGTYCMSIREEIKADHLPPSFGICFVDTATAEFSLCAFADDIDRTKLETLILQIKPVELVLEKGVLSKQTVRLIKTSLEKPQLNFLVREKEFWDEATTLDELRRGPYFKNATSEQAWPQALQTAMMQPLAMSALGGLLSYLRSLKLDSDLVSAGNFHIYDPIRSSGTLILDGQTLLNLEIFENSSDGSDRGTLFKLLSHCETPFGKRMFKQWVCHPLRSVDALRARLDAVDDLTAVVGMLDNLRSKFRKLPDLERIVARIHTRSCRVKDFVSALAAFDAIHAMLKDAAPLATDFKSKKLRELFAAFPSELVTSIKYFEDAFDHREAMEEDKIRLHAGYDDDFDAADEGVARVEERLEAYRRECETKLGFKGVSYKDMGKEIYQLELPTRIKAPKDWTVMSNTKAVNRYYTPVIRDLVTQLLEAREVREEAMRNIKNNIFAKFDSQYKEWMAVIRAVAEIDCLISLAVFRQRMPGEAGQHASALAFQTSLTAPKEPACRPEFVERGPSVVELEELRHPCIVQTPGSAFIPNDTRLGGQAGSHKMILLTGPNMGGKSTLLRQTCIAVIMAQLGCYVPARKCRLTTFDRIFTRIGANDNIMAGQSTFMVELSETSKILREATPRSLVILDELGRGTSTYDGYAIAYAVLHHLVTHIGCLGLFSTHYGTLTNEFETNPLVALMYMSFVADEANRQVTFLYKLTSGSCPKSYGMNVASLAEVPQTIVDRAEEVARRFQAEQMGRQAAQQQHKLGLGELVGFADLVRAAESPAVSDRGAAVLHAVLAGLASRRQ